MPDTAILWFRRDLRLADNPALVQAMMDSEQVLPLYIHDPAAEAPWTPGAASRWWLHGSLTALDRSLQSARQPAHDRGRRYPGGPPTHRRPDRRHPRPLEPSL